MRKKIKKLKETRKTKKINLVCEARLKKYFSITEKALKIAGKSINPKNKTEADILLDMSQRYFDDALYFKKKGHFVNAFACLNYSHGWLDAGSKLGIFKIKDSKIFVIK